MGDGGPRAVLDCAVSWPGIRIDEVAAELSVRPSTVSRYAREARRAGWLRVGVVPRLVDVEGRLVPDWAAGRAQADALDRAAFARVCLHYVAGLPARRGNMRGARWTDGRLRRALSRMRASGLVAPIGALYPTPEGKRLALG
jgi:phage protein U